MRVWRNTFLAVEGEGIIINVFTPRKKILSFCKVDSMRRQKKLKLLQVFFREKSDFLPHCPLRPSSSLAFIERKFRI